jgi:putative ABC transport system substrate-binding protein
MKRILRGMTVAVLALIAVPLAAEAQAAGKVPRVGVLMFTDAALFQGPFRQGLRDHGYVEGQNIVVEWRAAEGRADRAATLAAELVQLNVDVIVATWSPAVQAAKNATTTIPIVMAPAGDPVGQGFVASLARPGGNITGVTGMAADLSGKRLQLLQELIPSLNRVAVLLNGTDPFAKPFLRENETATKKAAVQLHAETVRPPQGFEVAFGAMAKARAGAVIVQPSLLAQTARAAQIAELALRHRLGSVSAGAFADSGGLLSYGPSFSAQVQRAAVYVDKILKGAQPRDLPVEQPTTFDFVINLRTAKALGITISPSILLRADRVIE